MNVSEKIARLWVLMMCVMALGAPYLATSKPYLYVSSKGEIYFPAFDGALDFDELKKNEEPSSAWSLKAIVPYSPNEYNFETILEKPSLKHLMGTDEQGRDLFSRLIHGSRVSLSVGLVAVLVSALLGLILGSWAGYFGGKVDFVISRLIEVVICFPTFLLILALVSIMPSNAENLFNMMLVIGLTGWTGIARQVRQEFLKQKTLPYVQAAYSLGYSSFRIIFLHILPTVLLPVLVLLIFGMGNAILTESALSYLGFGTPPDVPSWGGQLSSAKNYIDTAWWLNLFPGFMLFLTLLSLNVLGEKIKGNR